MLEMAYRLVRTYGMRTIIFVCVLGIINYWLIHYWIWTYDPLTSRLLTTRHKKHHKKLITNRMRIWIEMLNADVCTIVQLYLFLWDPFLPSSFPPCFNHKLVDTLDVVVRNPSRNLVDDVEWCAKSSSYIWRMKVEMEARKWWNGWLKLAALWFDRSNANCDCIVKSVYVLKSDSHYSHHSGILKFEHWNTEQNRQVVKKKNSIHTVSFF